MRTACVGVIVGLLWPIAGYPQAAAPAGLARDWVVAIDRYGETDYQRMAVQAGTDNVTVTLGGLRLEGDVREGRIDLHRVGKDGPPVSMTGSVQRAAIFGELTI